MILLRSLLLVFAITFTASTALQAAPASSAQSSAAAKAKAKAKKTKAKAKARPKAKKPSAAQRRAALLKAKRKGPRVDYAGQQVNFTQWKAVSDFADEIALRHGFPRAELDMLIGQLRYVDSAVQLVKPAPRGKRKNITAVRDLLIEPVRIKAGVKFWIEHADVLAKAEKEYGVPAEIIVGIIGIETVYGRNTGGFRVLDVLATLGFAYPEVHNQAARMEFFRGELENALVLARQHGIDPFSLRGSFAGAIGLPQFMPGSILAYGVDYDGDGAVDLRNSPADAIGSVANFLVNHGWVREHNGPLVYRARVAGGGSWRSFINQGLSAKFKLPEMRAAGVSTVTRPPPERLYGLVDLQNGSEATEYWVATNNFFAITQYNRSYFYAISVIELGRAVKLRLAAMPLTSAETL